MKIETKEDWNMVLEGCGCCPMPLCPVPGEEWQSVTSFAKAYGVLNEDDDKLYQRRKWFFAPVGSTSNSDLYAEWNGSGWTNYYDSEPPGPEYEDMRIEYSGDAHLLNYYDPHVARHVYGRSTCFQELELPHQECDGTQTQTHTEWTGFTNTGEAFYTPVTYSGVSTYTEVGGDETDEHAAWILLWGDVPTWQAAHDAWVIAHAAWQAASDAYEQELADYYVSEDYILWQADWDAWDQGGKIGPEPQPPTPPEPFTDPEPQEPAGEPTEFYPPCTVRRMLHEELFAYEYDVGFGLVPSTEEEPNPIVYDSGPEYFQSFIGNGGDKEHLDVINYAEILAAAQAGLVDVDYDSCAVIDPLLVARKASMVSTAPETTDHIEISLVQPRFRDVIPQDWGADFAAPGSYFKISWDLVFFPEGHDPEDPESPQPEKVGGPDSPSETWTWVGPGDPEDDDSWKGPWYVIDSPTEPGEVRRVNKRFECYNSTKFGNRPQVTGEAVELPNP